MGAKGSPLDVADPCAVRVLSPHAELAHEPNSVDEDFDVGFIAGRVDDFALLIVATLKAAADVL